MAQAVSPPGEYSAEGDVPEGIDVIRTAKNNWEKNLVAKSLAKMPARRERFSTWSDADVPDLVGLPGVPRERERRRLRGVRVPTLVVHGLADKMVHVSGGRATAAAIPGAELLLIDGMGHDLPPELFETFVAGIRRTADRAK